MNEAPVVRSPVLSEAIRRLAAAGIPEPAREAARLWAGAQGGDPAAAMVRSVERRASGEPLAHVTGTAGFRHLELRCDGRALIPRPETEGLVDLVLARVREGRALDVGTGSGCIALSLAQEGNFHLVVGVDQSREALGLARENVRLTGLDVRLAAGDLCEGFVPDSFDVLVANPPYLTDEEYRTLDPSVKGWEPAGALASGPDGLDATRRLLRSALAVVRPGGWIGLEVDCIRAAQAGCEAAALGWTEVCLYEDLFKRPRYLIARRSEWN